MSERKTASMRLTDRDVEHFEKLKQELGVSSDTEVMRRAVAQASFLSDIAKDGYLTVVMPDGKEMLVPLKV